MGANSEIRAMEELVDRLASAVANQRRLEGLRQRIEELAEHLDVLADAWDPRPGIGLGACERDQRQMVSDTYRYNALLVRGLLDDATERTASDLSHEAQALAVVDELRQAGLLAVGQERPVAPTEREVRYVTEWGPVSKWPDLPMHRTEAGWPNCATCEGGGCPDCTDPA